MRPIHKGFVPTFGSCIFLAIVATASVGLNANLWGPPRFDGAGYAVLATALASGRGYREISQPASPRHDHFPPAYPAALALLWQFTGRSIVAAHIFSACCTVAAVLLAWRWFRMIYPPRQALVLGFTLAINWTWGRIGGSIQSEPFYMFWELLIILLAVGAQHHSETIIGIVLGLVLAVSMLSRHIGVCLAVAVALDLGLRGRWRVLLIAALSAIILVLPWAGWLAMVHRHTQLGLFTADRLMARIAGQAVFYFQRLPDQLTGPFIEVATSSHRPLAVAVAANLWAAIGTGAMAYGWMRTLQTPRRRLGGIIPITTLALLLVWPFTEAGRFLVPLLPFLLVGLTEGLGHILVYTGLRQSRNWAVAIILAVSIPYATYAVVNGRARAQDRIHVDFDAACQWIAQNATQSGPILTRHPGEVFWQTGRAAVEPGSAEPKRIDQLIDRLGVAYLLIDEDRYINATSSPLTQYIAQYPDRVAFVWGGTHGMASIQVFEIRRTR